MARMDCVITFEIYIVKTHEWVTSPINDIFDRIYQSYSR